MSERVRETFEATIQQELLDPCDEYTPMLRLRGFEKLKIGDRVKVTVERLPAPRPKGGRK